MNNSKTIIADEQKLNDAVIKITEQILNNAVDTKKIALIGIVTRGEILARRISKMLEQKGVTIEFGIMDITLYRDDFQHHLRPHLPRCPGPSAETGSGRRCCLF